MTSAFRLLLSNNHTTTSFTQRLFLAADDTKCTARAIRVTRLYTFPVPKTALPFIAPMLLLRTEKLPEGPDWLYEVKIDGYRAIAGRFGSDVLLRSRNNSDFTGAFPAIAAALNCLPYATVVDGEMAVLDAKGRPFLRVHSESPLGGRDAGVFRV